MRGKEQNFLLSFSFLCRSHSRVTNVAYATEDDVRGELQHIR